MDTAKFTKALFTGIHEWIAPAFSEVGKEIKNIKKRLATVEQNAKGLNLAEVHRGTFKSGETYKRGELLTHDGGLWLCCHET